MTPEPSDTPRGASKAFIHVRSIASAAIAGVVYAVLAVLALRLLTHYPQLALPDEELTAWFGEPEHLADLLTGLNLAAISSIAFLWFVAVIRRQIGDREDQFFSTVFFGSAIVYVSLWLASAALLAAPAVVINLRDSANIEGTSAALAFGTASVLTLVVGPRIQAVFVFTTSTLIMRTGALPRWLAYWGYLMGAILLLVPFVTEPLGIGLPIWVFVSSVTIIVQQRRSKLQQS
ncbi:MAG TPA: hypothetical protein VLG28_18820 [Acidimicrobiia bacterium]|jgi:hypothetical protein|nr:hypothetical protein [Acidimicrobiia bacterium]